MTTGQIDISTAPSSRRNGQQSAANTNDALFALLSEPEKAAALAHVAQRPPANGHEPTSQPHVFPTWNDLDGIIAPITWPWPGWLPNSLVTMIVAEVGMGKSTAALRTAATFIDNRFNTWPDGSLYDGPLGRVVWAEAEQAQAVHLERVTAWGLDKCKFIVPTFGRADDDFDLESPDKWRALEEAAFLPDVRLIVVDSLSGSNRREENRGQQLELVQRLAGLARDCQRPMLITHHLRKRGLMDSAEVTLDRVRGHTSILQLARVVWALDAPDVLDKEARRLSQIKNNLRRPPAPLGMRISERGVEFEDAPEAPRPISQQEAAVTFLLALLQSEPLPAEQVLEQARLNGHSERTIKRAKTTLGINSVKKATSGGSWFWSLPVKQ